MLVIERVNGKGILTGEGGGGVKENALERGIKIPAIEQWKEGVKEGIPRSNAVAMRAA